MQSQCTDKMKCWNQCFVYFFKEYFSINRTDFCSFDVVSMVLKNDIHRYTDKYSSVLFLKKNKQSKTKQSKDFDSFSFDNFFQQAAAKCLLSHFMESVLKCFWQFLRAVEMHQMLIDIF